MTRLLLLLLLAPAFAQDAPPAEADAVDPLSDDEVVLTDREPVAAPVFVPTWTPEIPVSEVLFALGEAKPDHWREATPELVRAGQELFETGRTRGPDGKKVKKTSREFECSDCHNAVLEDPDLRASDAAARLDHAVANDLLVRPGTTMYGTVDRTSWFNDDYVVKYGDLVKPANEKLVEALQLCSVECSQGRALTDWEVDAFLAYFWSIGLIWSDLPTDGISLAEAEQASQGDDAAREAARLAVREKFLAESPATFGKLPADHAQDGAGYGLTGDAERGGQLYKAACLSCHGKGGTSFYRLADKRGRYAELRRNQHKDDKWSYWVSIREGTKPQAGQYMPLWTEERLSDQQLEDLRAWIDQNSAKKKK